MLRVPKFLATSLNWFEVCSEISTAICNDTDLLEENRVCYDTLRAARHRSKRAFNVAKQKTELLFVPLKYSKYTQR